jgi:uncharacterized protein (UPF0332 family)
VLDQTKIDLSKYRIEAAYEDYHAAVDLLKMGHYKVANNRAYYAIFHAMRAVLALDGADFKKHSGVIAYFRQNYIKSGIFDSSLSEIINDASFIRNESDYSDFYIATKEEAESLIAYSKIFLQRIKEYIDDKTRQ